MSEATNTGSATGTTSGTQGTGTQTGTPNSEPQVTSEQFTELTRQFGQFAKQTREFIDAQKKAAAAAPAKEEPETIKAGLEALRASVMAEREAAANEKREAAIHTAIAGHGVTDDDAELLFDHIAQRHGGAIKIVGKMVVWEDPITVEQKPLKDFIGGLLTGTKGDRFRKAPGNGADTSGLGRTRGQNNAPRVTQLTEAEQDKLYAEGKLGAMVKKDMEQ